jgi:hypothetical protein
MSAPRRDHTTCSTASPRPTMDQNTEAGAKAPQRRGATSRRRSSAVTTPPTSATRTAHATPSNRLHPVHHRSSRERGPRAFLRISRPRRRGGNQEAASCVGEGAAYPEAHGRRRSSTARRRDHQVDRGPPRPAGADVRDRADRRRRYQEEDRREVRGRCGLREGEACTEAGQGGVARVVRLPPIPKEGLLLDRDQK